MSEEIIQRIAYVLRMRAANYGIHAPLHILFFHDKIKERKTLEFGEDKVSLNPSEFGKNFAAILFSEHEISLERVPFVVRHYDYVNTKLPIKRVYIKKGDWYNCTHKEYYIRMTYNDESKPVVEVLNPYFTMEI